MQLSVETDARQSGRREPCISLDRCIHCHFVKVLEFELSCFSSGHSIIGEASRCSVKVDVVYWFWGLACGMFCQFDVLPGGGTRDSARGRRHGIELG
jgi:hypothetical protein